jgi:hypothetical protein
LISYYGDNFRWFVADVIDSTPPYGLEGRVRVRIHGVHNPSTREVRQNELPWAQVVLPTTEGGVSGIGSTPRLEAGALVFGIFMDGKESQVPIVLGSLPRTEFPTAIQKSLAYDDLIDRVNPNVDFYNQSISGIDEKDSALQNESLETLLGSRTANYRRDVAIRFFLSNGYTIKQSSAIVGCISKRSSTFSTTYENKGGTGLMGWSDLRFTRLKQFTNTWWHFSSQLAFILYELNTTHVDANIRILNSDVIDPAKGKSLGSILGKFYMPIKDSYDSETKRIYELYANKKV